MIIGFTGHRPKHLPGNYSNNTYKVLLKTANYILEKYQPTTVISGLALGWDLAVAESAFKKNITVIAAIPFVGQEKKWQKKDQEKYHKLLEKSEQIIVSPGGYSPKKLMIRNQFIVEHSNIIFSLRVGSPAPYP